MTTLKEGMKPSLPMACYKSNNGQWEITKDKQGFDVFYHCELKEIEWAKEPGV